MVLALAANPVPAAAPIEHKLSLEFPAAGGELSIADRLQAPGAHGPLELNLGAWLAVDAPARVVSRHGAVQRVQVEPDSAGEYRLRYHGRPPAADRMLSLSPDLYWLPELADRPIVFSLDARLPQGWSAVSQGERTVDTHGEHFRISEPQEAAWFYAAPFARYMDRAGEVPVEALLQSPDPELAARYLPVTREYLAEYAGLLGPYPYASFAIVENTAETGYGMPGFTLLGPRVLRLPFILRSSLPHEIVHNWFGNGVYVGDGGNWSEGLTSYLADHREREKQGDAARHRRNTLQSYANFAREASDFPLTGFRARHSEATQAVGYGKSLFLWHMLRVRLGDQVFIAGLRDFIARHRFERAGFDDLRESFERTSGADLSDEFAQWIERTGAPILKLEPVRAEKTADGQYTLNLRLRQTQDAPAYRLRIPIAITLRDDPAAFETTVSMNTRDQTFAIALSAEPLRVDIDPQFDLFRRVDAAEIPPSFGELFGAQTLTLALPAATDPEQATAWRALADAWSARYPGAGMLDDDQPFELEQPAWLFRQGNGLADPEDAQTTGAFTASGKTYDLGNHCVASVKRNAMDVPVGRLICNRPPLISALARRLPHYSRSSYVVFNAETGARVADGQWEVDDGPLTRQLGEAVQRAGLRPRPVLGSPM